mgnify:CR=1 FL=1
MKRITPLFLAAALMTAQATMAETIADTAWTPVALNDTPFEPAGETFVQFNPDGSYFGKDGCNRIRGRYVTNGDAVLLGPAAATMMACPQEIMEQAQAVTKALMAARNYEIRGEELVLLDAEANTLVRLAPRDTE